jgi:hypothetical protein
MYNAFEKHYDLTQKEGAKSPLQNSRLLKVRGAQELVEKFGGISFFDGAYRVCSGRRVEIATAAFVKGLPQFAHRIVCFGYDWLGRHFAADFGRMESGEPLVLMLEPGTGQALEIPATIVDFHNQELVGFSSYALSLNFYNQWKELHPEPIGFDECVGYKIPLFLKGSDTIDNLETIDLDVYLEISFQLLNGVKKMPAGATIRKISIS